MQAVIASDGRTLVPGERAIPEPGPGEARIRVTACGICGTDLHLRHLGALRPGGIPGHEIAGVVDAIGRDVSGVAAGDAVAVEPLATCGGCAPCRTGRDSICPEMTLFGLQRDGGMAGYVVVPAHRLYRAPRDLPPRVAALAEPMAVCVHGLVRGGFDPAQRVLVIGAGSVGLLCVLAARALGAHDVTISARHAHQAELARALGATRVLAESEASPAALGAVPRGEAWDLVVETVGGTADTLRSATAALAPGGTVSVLGLFTKKIELEPYWLLVREATLAWSNCYHRRAGAADFDAALAILDRERERAARLLTHAFPFAEVERAYATASDKKAGAIKVTLVPAAS